MSKICNHLLDAAPVVVLNENVKTLCDDADGLLLTSLVLLLLLLLDGDVPNNANTAHNPAPA